VKSVYVALFAGALVACGTRVSLGELVPDERSGDRGTDEGKTPAAGPSADASPGDDASDAIDAGPGPGIDGGDIDGGKAPYLPCAGKACGDDCSACDPTDPNCVETGVEKACDKNGACLASPAQCS
jgi:hypothetical protein